MNELPYFLKLNTIVYCQTVQNLVGWTKWGICVKILGPKVSLWGGIIKQQWTTQKVSKMWKNSHFLQFLHTKEYVGKIPLFGISCPQTESYFWYQTAIKTKPLTFLHFNWMDKECARPKKSNFKLSFFSLSNLHFVVVLGGKWQWMW